MATVSCTTELDAQARRKAAVMAELDAHPFRPAPWLGNPHLQTCWGPMCRNKRPVPLRVEEWPTDDGDNLRLYFYESNSEAPWLLLLHGLEGCAHSFYMLAYNRRFHALGWNVATMEFRTCGGHPNKAKRAYHMGETSDFDFAVRRMRERIGAVPLAAIGTSLGGNVLAKWLGEQGETAHGLMQAAVAVSPPFDPMKSAPQFEQALRGIYMRRFMRSLLAKALIKAEQHPGFCDVDALRQARDFTTFDTLFTAPLHGFQDAHDYWTRVGCHQFLDAIRVPTLLITSADDPFNHPDTIPWEAVARSPWLHGLFTETGGHVGFVTGPPHAPRYWNEDQAQRFLLAYCGDAIGWQSRLAPVSGIPPFPSAANCAILTGSQGNGSGRIYKGT